MITNIELKNINPSGFNPRKTFSEEALNELSASIKEQGVLQPIVVRPKGKKYEIVCGERRYRASKLAGVDTIPVIIRELSDDQAMDIAITENLQRKDVDPLEEAAAFNLLIERGQTVDDLAARFGKSGMYIRGRLKLNDLIPEFVEMITNRTINVSQGLELCKYGKDLQEEVYKDHYADNVYRYYRWNDLSVKELKGNLQQYRMNLEDAKFDKTDCFKCPDNTGYSCLFPELGKVSCNNRNCFKNKILEYTKNEALRVMEHEPEVILFVDQYQFDKNEPIVSFVVEKGGVVENNENWIKEYEPVMPDKPERDDFDEDEDGEGEYQVALEEYPHEVEEYEKELEKFKQDVLSGKIRKAFVVGNSQLGEYLYVKPSYRAQNKMQNTSNSEEVLLAELQKKDERNKEIAMEKTVEECRSHFKKKISENVCLSPVTEFETKMMYFAMLESLSEAHKKEFFNEKYWPGDKEKMQFIDKLTEEQKIIVLRDYIMKQVGENVYRREWLVEWVRSYFPEFVSEVELKHRETYLKRKEKIDAKIAEIELQKMEGKK